jgi:hypothetical protein
MAGSVAESANKCALMPRNEPHEGGGLDGSRWIEVDDLDVSAAAATGEGAR